MWSSLPASRPGAPGRRRALFAAVFGHAVVLGSVFVGSEWQVEAVTPPDLRTPPPAFLVVRLLEAGGSPAAARPVQRDPPPQQSRPAPPAVGQAVVQLGAPSEGRPITADPTTSLTSLAADGKGSGEGKGKGLAPAAGGEASGDVDGGEDEEGGGDPGEIFAVGAAGVIAVQALVCPPPLYSAQARTMRLEGQVGLAAVIDRDGRAREIRVLGGHPILADLARDSLAGCRFAPARYRGRAVPSEYILTVTFELR